MTLRERIELKIALRMFVEEVRDQLRGKQKEAVENACKTVVDKTAETIVGLTKEVEKLQKTCNHEDHRASKFQAKLTRGSQKIQDMEGPHGHITIGVENVTLGVWTLNEPPPIISMASHEPIQKCPQIRGLLKILGINSCTTIVICLDVSFVGQPLKVLHVHPCPLAIRMGITVI